MDEVSIHPPEAASKRSSVVSYPESPRSLRSPRQINFVNEGKDVWDTREKPVVFTARKESLKDVFDGSRRRVSEFNPPKSIMSPSAGRRRSTRVSLSAKPAEPVPKRFSMYMPSSPSRRRSTSRNNVAAVSSLDDLYQESMPPPLSSSLLLSETAPAASTRRMEGINRRISLLEEEFK
ncbi:hypothetical protein AGDE_14826 [Angomonas deanei]|uniref:Uncharacterized protein n=1 Tax=Angomonas deanei TaxID=59799 RepID=A0A7G2CK90_9TRYP|nr:hypothetical protein AGDE_14826 [Angomonas deanei]CAD2220288.1 hypothetical protein, conserved [Angomonas deanei]|eukprot:EPY20151.1 hypothetical protein AGDE_14826 [Angomonas deanei]